MRLFAPLIFLCPRIIPVIDDGTAPVDLTVTSLAKALPYSQAQQERDRIYRVPQPGRRKQAPMLGARHRGHAQMSLQLM